MLVIFKLLISISIGWLAAFCFQYIVPDGFELPIVCDFIVGIAVGCLVYVYMPYRQKISSWTMRTTESAPSADTINVEIRAVDGHKKVLWGVRPQDIDFTDSALEPVISFLIVK